MSSTFINVHPETVSALRTWLGTAEGDEREADLVTSFIQNAIEAFRSRPDSDRDVVAADGPRWPAPGDTERISLAITQDGQDDLNRFLTGDWATTGIGFSEFIRRALADPAIA